MQVKVGINGFGRVGRAIFRHLLKEDGLTLSHVNDPSIETVQQLLYYMRFDTVYGRSEADVFCEDDKLYLNGSRVRVSGQSIISQPAWEKSSVNVVVDASGVSRPTAEYWGLNKRGMEIVVTNHDVGNVLLPGKIGLKETVPSVIGASICDMVASAPILDVVDDAFSIEKLSITTLHPFLNYQNLLDGTIPSTSGGHNVNNLALSRSSFGNLIPKNTSLSYLLRNEYPKISAVNAFSFRVPTSAGCTAQAIFDLKSKVSRQDFVTVLLKEPRITVVDQYLTSVDVLGREECAIILKCWLHVDRHRVVMVYMYDNEYGYAHHVINVIKAQQKML